MPENKERWRELCEQAAVEHDSAKLQKLVKEISDLLEARRQRLNGETATAPTHNP